MWGDLDALGIVFYPRYYEWIDAAAHLFFDSIGLDMNNLRQRQHLVFGLVETCCGYRQPGRYHQKIRITTHLGELGLKTLVLHHAIAAAEGGAPMVDGREKRICLDVRDPLRLKAVAFPEGIYRILKEKQAEA